MKDQKYEGKGILFKDNGDKLYEGEFKEGLYHG